MKVKVQYFAMLKESSGKSEEEVEIDSMTIDDFYAHLDGEYQFKLKGKDIRYAVNDNFVDCEYVLKENDDIVFIPPVGGG
jgi:molybdopterin converting factor subunit 1